MKISLCVVIFLLIVFSSSCSQQNVVENVMEIDQHSLSYYVGRGISAQFKSSVESHPNQR